MKKNNFSIEIDFYFLTGKKAKLLETDSLKKIEKKIRKVLEKGEVKVLFKKI